MSYIDVAPLMSPSPLQRGRDGGQEVTEGHQLWNSCTGEHLRPGQEVKCRRAVSLRERLEEVEGNGAKSSCLRLLCEGPG